MQIILCTLFIYGLFCISNNFYRKLHFERNIIIFSVFFTGFISLIYLIISYSFLFNINTFFLSIIIAFFLIIYGFYKTLYSFLSVKNFVFKKFKIKKNHTSLLVLIILLLYYLSSFIPVSDVDSLRYHLEIPRLIKKGFFYENYTLDYVTLGSNEFLNLFGLNLKFENTSSVINVIFLMIISYINYSFLKKEKTSNLNIKNLMILSSPYVFSVSTTQKIFILPCFLVIYSLIYLIHQKSEICYNSNKLIAFVLPFAISIKFIFAPICLIIYLYQIFLIKRFKNIFFITIIYVSSFILFALPICIIKFRIFGEPFVPLYLIDSANIEWFKNIKSYLTNYDNKLTFLNLIFLPVKFIYPIKLNYLDNNFINYFATSEIFKLLGIGFLSILFLNNKKTKIYFILSILFLSIISTGNIQIRWFLPILMFVSFFYNYNNPFNTIFKFLIFLQSYFISVGLVLLTFMSIYGNFINKDRILNQMSYGYKVSREIEKKYSDLKILTYNEGYFYHNNYVPLYKSKDLLLFDKKYYKNLLESEKKFIFIYPNRLSTEKITELIGMKNIKIRKIDMLNEFFSTRLFVFKHKAEIFIYEIELN
tara:strand:+ start:11042 stop:12814 length:1773 start_codon:yes stop_codon:yes gene_type:complete